MNTREIIQNTLDYIENNLKAELSVDELCSMAGYSYVHYCRIFKHFVGLTPAEYINRRKLLYAVYDMYNGSAKINTALDYGFKTYAGFYKAFTREFNCSPSEFIKLRINTEPYRINIFQEEHIMISKTKIKNILRHWNLQDEHITNIYNENTGKQNDNAYYIGDEYVIKFSANLAEIKNNIRISERLSDSGLPAAEMVKTLTGDKYLQIGELYFILTKRINGKPLKCEEIFKDITLSYQIGKSIARLHNALKIFDESKFTHVNIYDNAVKSALPKVEELTDLGNDFVCDYINQFGTVYSNLPKQIIHRDINPSNMIFNNGKFNGFVDFDLTEVNLRIFDICYCATSILSEAFTNDNIDKEKWTDILKELIRGYGNINPLTENEKQALPYVIYSIQFVCIAYFNKFDKYSNLTKTNIEMLKWMINKMNNIISDI